MSEYDDKYRLANRLTDLGLAYLNGFISLMLLTAPWYKVTSDTMYHNCMLSKGTVIAPFASGLCTYDSFFDIPEDGDKWNRAYIFCWLYFLFSIGLCMFAGFEAYRYGVRPWKKGLVISFATNLSVLLLQVIIFATVNRVMTPDNNENVTARTVIILGIAFTTLRLPVIGYFMYLNNKDVINSSVGKFGSGVRNSY